ncbi:MAG TPA: hypothetical protein VG708_11720 [Mycobacteriales bacterium]|nr:hypothetical protein [Mycobacteriales bacterium]
MTDFTASYDAFAAEVRDRGTRDGGLLAVFCDDAGRLLLPVEFDEGTSCVDELFLRYLVAVICDIALPAVVLAVARRSGRPARIDRALWRELSSRLSGGPTRLVDLLVVGSDGWWSATAGKLAA